MLGKACRGLALDPAELAAAAGLSPQRLAAALAGQGTDAELLTLAPHLGLHGPALVALARGAWRPQPVELDGLAQFNTPFGDMAVNSWLVWDPATRLAAAFDSGADATPMLRHLDQRQLRLAAVFLTHTHRDHIADLPRLCAACGNPPVHSHAREPLDGTQVFEICPETCWRIGALRISPRSTHGHSRGGVSYLVSGAARPIAIVGDALFAGSMGGGAVSYADALRTTRAEILSLPAATVLCPGHGPATSAGEERRHNPFFATADPGDGARSA